MSELWPIYFKFASRLIPKGASRVAYQIMHPACHTERFNITNRALFNIPEKYDVN